MNSLYSHSVEDINMHPVYQSSSSHSTTPALTDSGDYQVLPEEWFKCHGLTVPDFTTGSLAMPASIPVSSAMFLSQDYMFMPNITMDMPLAGLNMTIVQPEMAIPTSVGCGSFGSCVDTPQALSTTVKTEPSISNDSLRRRNAVFVPREISEAVMKNFPAKPTNNSFESVTYAERLQARPTRIKQSSKTKPRKSNSRSYDGHINSILESWFNEHKVNPYASLQEKKRLMKETGLSKMQLKNWFCNVRRRRIPHAIKRSKSAQRPTRASQVHYYTPF